MASVSPTRINSNPRIASSTPATSRQAASSASPVTTGIITASSLHHSSASQDETKSTSVLHGRIPDFNGHTSFIATDGRVKNPIPSKLKGITDNRSGNFAVMHIELARSEKSMRNDAAKRTSEGTEAAARIANQAGYQSVKRSKLAWQPSGVDPSSRDIKAEQTRLLAVLRSQSPSSVVDQLCKAISYFGGAHSAPSHDGQNVYPQSHQSNGSGSLLVCWLAELFPQSAPDPGSLATQSFGPSHPNSSEDQIPPLINQPPPGHNATQPEGDTNMQSKATASEPAVEADATAAPVKRGRGRPKGSKGKPKNKEHAPPHDAEPMASQNSQGPPPGSSWPGQPLYQAQQGTADQPETGTPGKKRGRPKGSRNKPKDITPVDQPEPGAGQDADATHESFLSPMAQISNSISLGQDGARTASAPLGLSNMIESSSAQTQGNWTSIGLHAGSDAGPATSRKRKGDKSRHDTANNNASMPQGVQQDSSHSIEQSGKRRRVSKDNAAFPQPGQPRMDSADSPVPPSSFPSTSQQMMSSGTIDPAQQSLNRKPSARSQPPNHPAQSQPQQQHFNQQPNQPQPHLQQSYSQHPHQAQPQQQAFTQQPNQQQSQQHTFNQQQGQPQQPFSNAQQKSPVVGGNVSPSTMDMSGPGISRSVMYNQQQQQQFQHFMNQQRLSVDMNSATNSPNQFTQGHNSGKSPMFPQGGHMVRAASGDAAMHQQQRPSPAGQTAQLAHDGSRIGPTGFTGRAPPATSAGGSPSINSPFPPSYTGRTYMGMNYGGMGGGRVPDATGHPFGGSAGQMDAMGNADQANMRHRMYQSMQQQQQQQQQQQRRQ